MTSPCPWCEKYTGILNFVRVVLPDDDYIDVCEKCALEHEMKKEERYQSHRVIKKDGGYENPFRR